MSGSHSHRWATDDQRGQVVFAESSVGQPRQDGRRGCVGGRQRPELAGGGSRRRCVVMGHVCRQQGV